MSNPKMNPKLGVIYLIMSPWSSKNQNENFAQICHHTINISFIFTTPWVHDPSPSHINSKKNLHGSMKATFTVERIETTVEIKGGFIVGWWPPLFRENKEIAALEAGLRSTSRTPRVWLRIVPFGSCPNASSQNPLCQIQQLIISKYWIEWFIYFCVWTLNTFFS